MLVGQATALQTIFTSLARRAQEQSSQRNLEAFSRACIESAGTEPGDHIGIGGLEVSSASYVCKTGQHCPQAATGEQRRGGWR